PDGFNIPYDAEQIHGISTELAEEKGVAIGEVLEKFNAALSRARFVVGQNVGFDLNIMGAEFHRYQVDNKLQQMPVLDTCTEHTAQLCQIPGGRGGKFKLPTLTELHQYLFGEPFAEAHNATADVEATTRCFLELLRRREYTLEQLDVSPDYFKNFSEANPQEIQLIGLKHINLKKASKKIADKLWALDTGGISQAEIKENIKALGDAQFVHLHNHSQFSVLQSTMSVAELVQIAAKERMPAVALTDHANMMGAFHFVKAVSGHNSNARAKNAEAMEKGEEALEHEIKPILGCEFFVCGDHTNKNVKDYGYQVVFLAKNKKGYLNMAKMSSLAY